jgi:hypothetical protein
MSHPTDNTHVITRDDYLAMTPAVYLAAGFRDDAGNPRPELTGIWATAGATQLEPLTSNEVATTLLGLSQTLPLHDKGTPSERYRDAVAEAQELTIGVLNKAPSPELRRWLTAFIPYVRTDQDLQDLCAHLAVTACQHSLFAAMLATHRA